MKKMMMFALVAALMVSLAVPASAVGSVTATEEDLKPTVVPAAPVEEESQLLVSAEANEFAIVSAEEVEELTEEAQEVFVASKDALEAAVPEDMAVRYFFYCITDETSSAVFDLSETIDLTNYNAEEVFEDLAIMQFIDGEWVEVAFTVNEDGTITVYGIVTAPMAIFVKRGE